MREQEYRDKRVVVMGLGRFGGGVGASKWLAEQGSKVTITDLADESQLADSIRQLQGLPVEFHLGGHRLGDLDRTDLLVVSPAVDKTTSEFVQAARRKHIPVTSEMNLFFGRCPAKIIGVTGSMGKSSTTAMMFDLLYAHLRNLKGAPRNIWLGGNIGRSLLSDLPAIAPEDYVVLELSSFQLEDLGVIRRSPHIAVLTNLHPHHLERHGNFRSYVEAKVNILAYQGVHDFALISEQAAAILAELRIRPSSAAQIAFGPADRLAGRMKVIGDHNLHNAAAAIHVGRLLELDDDIILEELEQFTGLPHRIEFVRTYQDVRYYNDSKATTPHATITALESMGQRVVLICGGCDQGDSLEKLSEAICRRARAVICSGENRAKIAAQIRRLGSHLPAPTIKSVHEFNGGVNLARRMARPGEDVLFSPGAASYDEFDNFEQRGNRFKAIVNQWI